MNKTLNINKTLNVYVIAILAVMICTVINFALYPYVLTSNLIIIYLLAVVIIAAYQNERYGPPFITALLSTIAFDFFFTQPRFNFTVQHRSDLVTLMMMFIVAQVLSHLTTYIRHHAKEVKVAQMQTETERFRNLLLSSISHDLRTPLSSIMGAASLFLSTEDKLSHVMRQELAQDIYNESDRLNRIVNNILQLVKLESQSLEINKQLNSIEEVIRAALDTLEKSLVNRHVNINLSPSLPPIIFDPMLIEKVLNNILENAIKFSDPSSAIDISAEIKNKYMMIKIGDRGPGIDENELKRIFTKFYQGRRLQNKGIGLGLAICKDILKAHGGDIWAYNRDGGGAVFCFTLPLAV